MAMRCRRLECETLRVLMLALCAAVLAFLVASRVYHHRVLTTDENSYLFQARNFIEGRIARPLPDMPHAFHHKMIIMDAKAGWLSRYPPVHALWLTPGVLLGYPHLMSLIGAAAGILLMSRIAVRLDLSGPLAAAILVVSPFYVFVYGTLLSHTSGFVLTAAMLLFHIRWQQQRRSMDAALAGLFWGLLFLNRTYTALLLAVPFGIDASVTFLAHRNRTTFRGCAAFAGVSALFVGLYRLYNKIATGSSRLPTFLMYDPSEGLGFGLRHTRGLAVHHTLGQGVRNVWHNLVVMDQWIWGIAGGLLLVGILSILGWRKRWTPLLLAAPACVWAGYVCFWYPGIEHFRPVYFFETIVFLVIAAATGFDRAARRVCRHSRSLLGAVCAVLVCFPLAGSAFIRNQALFFREHNRESRRVYDQIREAPPNALVLLEGFERKPLGENMLNLKGLASDPLVARGNAFWDDVLVTFFPDRTVYKLNPHSNGLVAFEPRAGICHQILAARAPRHTGSERADANGMPIRFADSSFAAGLLLFGRYPYVMPGRWRVRMLYSLKAVDADRPVRLEIAADRGRSILEHKNLHGSITNACAEITLTSQTVCAIEPRVHYGGSGTVSIQSVQIEQLDVQANGGSANGSVIED